MDELFVRRESPNYQLVYLMDAMFGSLEEYTNIQSLVGQLSWERISVLGVCRRWTLFTQLIS